MYARILVATDGSTLSKKAVNSAISLAALCGAELIALKVVPRYPQSYFEGSVPLAADDVARVEKQWADEGQAVVDEVLGEVVAVLVVGWRRHRVVVRKEGGTELAGLAVEVAVPALEALAEGPALAARPEVVLVLGVRCHFPTA